MGETLRDEYDWIIGVIDSNDALHYKKVKCGDNIMHSEYWPTIHHKRWRFYIRQWTTEKSPLSDETLNEEDLDRIKQLAYKICIVPKWIQQLDAWEKAGRPHGKKYDKWFAEYEKSVNIKS